MAPFKRQRQPKMTTQALLDFDLGESSSDSDFRIDDYDSPNSKDDEDGECNSSSTADTSSEDSNAEDDSEDSTMQLKQLLAEGVDAETGDGLENACPASDKLEEILKKQDVKLEEQSKVNIKPICCVCLGDRSDDSNEIVECDGCSVSVHEGCYGVSDNNSISSTNSTCSTEPWFCEACRAGVSEPTCELCPNKGGIYKETDVGKWVHLVCALYVPGVAFGEVDQLSSVTLFEMQYNKWGGKACSLCENSRFARTGVCIGCDAGMCKTYFHVTCAQAAGFLTEAHHEEADVADPFYAHCKVHSEKEMIKKRKRNFHTLRLNLEQKQKERKLLKLEEPCPAQMRIQRKLQKYQSKYAAHKQMRPQPWVPTQKMSRLLTTSASACRRLLAKADVMSVDVDLMERQEAQIAALTDIRKKWHVAPAFSVEFIAYYLDRISRTKELKQQLKEMFEQNSALTKDQDTLRNDYDSLLDKNKDLKTKNENLMDSINEIQKQISSLCPNKNLPNPANIGCQASIENSKPSSTSTPPSRPISVPTAAALKMGVGFPLSHLGPPGSKVDSNRLLSTHVNNSPSTQMPMSPAMDLPVYPSTSTIPTAPTVTVPTYECGICKKMTDQHLLAKCDTCKLHYHLGCLNPPLTRHPKKSKLYGWQCSECDKSDESDVVRELPKGPRKSRTRFNKDGLIVPVDKQVCDETQQNLNSTKKRTLEAQTNLSQTLSSPSLKRSHNRSFSTVEDVEDNQKKLANSDSAAKLSKKPKSSLNYGKPPSQQQQIASKKTKLNNEDFHSVSIKEPATNSTHNEKFAVEEISSIVNTTQPPIVMDSVMQMNVEADPLAIPAPLLANNAQVTLPDMVGSSSKQARKQKRKDKHKNKHNPLSDNERISNKEHKHKRKKSRRDSEAPTDTLAGIPKIKIKFKTLPLPGEVTPEAQFFYVPANMVRSAGEASRPTSVETIEDMPRISTPVQKVTEDTVATNKGQLTSPRSTSSKYAINSPVKTTPSSRKSSPRKPSQRRTSISARPSKAAAVNANQNLTCCVCQNSGTSGNAVTCDECRRHYHFTCLDPPLKKSPKIRGYSWHCADCDPTEEEKI
uniref:PHD finger protein 14 n=1 Tax=Glossina palpalis gambiensis TaxID=67801 RepID=A0A1B0BCV9_9MUSC